MKSDRRPELDAIRGLAAVAVAGGHCATAMSPRPLHATPYAQVNWGDPVEAFFRLWHVMFPADAAVMVFFVLSGFVLFISLRSLSDDTIAEACRYAVRRTLRILPAITATGLLLVALAPIPVKTFLLNAVLLDTSLHGLTWSMQVEVIGSALIFATAVAFRRHAVTLPLIFAATLALAYWHPANKYALYAPMFAFGAMLSLLPGGKSKVLLLVGVAMVMASQLVLGRSYTTITLVALGAGLIVANAGAFTMLQSRLFALLGLISYSLYLAHPVAARLWWMTPHPLKTKGDPALLPIYFAGTLTLAIAIAALVYLLVERPSIALGREIARRIGSRPQTQTQAPTLELAPAERAT